MLDTLQHLGLTQKESLVYMAALELGSSQASNIVRRTELPKSTVYNTLEHLVQKGLMSSYIRESIKIFTPEDPRQFKILLNNEKKSIFKKMDVLEQHLPELQGAHNPHIHNPKVRLYEGEEGVRTVLTAGMESSENISAIMHHGQMMEHFPELYAEFSHGCDKRGVKRDIICADMDNQLQSDPRTSVRSIIGGLPDMHVYMAAFDHFVHFVTFRKNNPLGVIIEDRDIAKCIKTILGVMQGQVV